MTLFTPVYAFPWPEETDAPDGSTQIHNLALAVEGELVADLAPLKAASTSTKTPTVFLTSSTLASSVYPNAKALRIEGCNGGGGAGGAQTTAAGQSAQGGPGGAGAVAVRTISTTGLVYPLQVNVGGGGAGGAAGNNGGTKGGQSSVITNNGAGTTIWTPGIQATNQAGGGGPAGAGIGDASVAGFDSSVSSVVADWVGTGTGPNNPTRVATTTISRISGASSPFGAGGLVGNGSAGSAAGANTGGGGGPGYIGASTTQVAGGAGGSGIVIITPIY